MSTINFYHTNAAELAEKYESLSAGDLHAVWARFLPKLPSMVLEVGAGTGRDAAWLAELGHEVVAVEPAEGMREFAMRTHTNPNIQWVDDHLPSLDSIREAGYRFSLILLSAVWMHVRDRERALRILASLLEPGGHLVITFRNHPFEDARDYYQVEPSQLSQQARDLALEVAQIDTGEDQFGRGITWHTVVLSKPDTGELGLPLIRHIIVNDVKASTYKLALLRCLVRIADGVPGIAEINNNVVELPFGLVALYWLRAYMPLRLTREIRQTPGSRGLGFQKAAFNKLQPSMRDELAVGRSFQGGEAVSLTRALADARNTIKLQPVVYTTYPGTDSPVFICSSGAVRASQQITLDKMTLSKFGTFRVPLRLWESMSRYAVWLEPAIEREWARLMQSYDSEVDVGDLYKALEWSDPQRATAEVRSLVIESDSEFTCVWHGGHLTNRFEIDHCFPFAHWPNNDLWNLLPSCPRCNQIKSDKLPSAERLAKAMPRILLWWDYVRGKYSTRFDSEFESVFGKGRRVDLMQQHRARLRVNMQIPEWD